MKRITQILVPLKFVYFKLNLKCKTKRYLPRCTIFSYFKIFRKRFSNHPPSPTLSGQIRSYATQNLTTYEEYDPPNAKNEFLKDKF